MSNSRVNLSSRGGRLHYRLRMCKGLLAVAVSAALLFGTPFVAAQGTDTGWTFGSTTAILAGVKNDTGTEDSHGDITVTGDGSASHVGLATNVENGAFLFGNITVNGSADAWDELVGFLYIMNPASTGHSAQTSPSNFSANISGGTIDVQTTQGAAFGVMFRNVITSVADADRWANISGTQSFGDITATTTDIAAGATGYTARSLLNGASVTIHNITAAGNDYTAGVALTGGIASGATFTVTGLVNVMNNGDDENAYGFTIWENVAGTLKASAITVGNTGTGNAYGIHVGGAANLELGGDIIVTASTGSAAYGIWTAGHTNITLLENNVNITAADGGVVVTNGGDLNLNVTGANDITANLGKTTVAGNFFIAGATVSVSAGSTFGSLENDGVLRLNGATEIRGAISGAGTINTNGYNLSIASGTFNGDITGTGQITKTGNGTLILTGNNSANHTIVAEGTLGGTTAGTGSNIGISGLVTVKNGAVLSPGTSADASVVSFGTLFVGNVDFELGSTYRFEFNESNSDLLSILDNGTVTIETGAKLEIIGGSGSTFKVIDNAGAINGLFDSGNWRSDIRETSSGWEYWITRITLKDRIAPYATPNALRVADAVESLPPSITSAISNSLGSNPRAMANFFGQLHGEVFATSKGAVVGQQRLFQQLLPTGREFYVSTQGMNAHPGAAHHSGEVPVYRGQVAPPAGVWNRWGVLTGGWQSREGVKRNSGYDWMSAGFAVGVDRTITQRFLFGMALGYDHSYMDFDKINSKADIGAFRTMLYGTWYNGTLYVDAYGGYTKNMHRTKREIDLRGFNFSGVPQEQVFAARSSYHDDMGSVGLEVGRVWNFGGYMVTPSAGLHYTRLTTPEVEEKNVELFGAQDPNLLRLRAHKGEFESLRLPIGVKASRVFATSTGVVLMPELRAVGTVELADDSARVQTSFVSRPDVNFYADSGRWGRYSGKLGAGLGAVIANRFNVRLDYDYEIFEHTSTNAFSSTVGIQW